MACKTGPSLDAAQADHIPTATAETRTSGNGQALHASERPQLDDSLCFPTGLQPSSGQNAQEINPGHGQGSSAEDQERPTPDAFEKSLDLQDTKAIGRSPSVLPAHWGVGETPDPSYDSPFGLVRPKSPQETLVMPAPVDIDESPATVSSAPCDRSSSLRSVFCFRGRGNKSNSSNPALLHLASLVKAFASGVKQIETDEEDNRNGHGEPKAVDATGRLSSQESVSEFSESHGNHAGDTTTKAVTLPCTHRRLNATPRASTSDLLKDVSAAGCIPLPRSDKNNPTTESVLQVHEQTLKHSIPHLMKALPPVPRHENAVQEVKTEEQSDGTDKAVSNTGKEQRLEPTPEEPGACAQDQVAGHSHPKSPQERIPKMRLNVKKSQLVGLKKSVESVNLGGSECTETDAMRSKISHLGDSTSSLNRQKPRLRLNTSRSALWVQTEDDTGTVKHRRVVEKSSVLSELVLQAPRDLFSPCRDPRSPDILLADHAAVSKERRFFSEGPNAQPRRGLRKRLSALKSKVNESHRGEQTEVPKAPGSDAIMLPQLSSIIVASAFDTSDTSGDLGLPGNKAGLGFSDAVRNRRIRRTVFRWLRDARRGVASACPKKRKVTV